MKLAGGLYHERDDAAQYSSWGVDFLKYDLCGQGNLQPFVTFQVMRDALNQTGRPMVYSCEPQQLRADPIGWPPLVSNLFRTAADMGAYYGLFTGDALLSNAWANVATKGGWTDPGYLEVGNAPTMISVPESRTQFVIWCIIKTALLVAADLSAMNSSDPYLQILKNPEFIAISQDKLGHIGRLVATGSAGNVSSTENTRTRPRESAERKRAEDGGAAEGSWLDEADTQRRRPQQTVFGGAGGVGVTACVFEEAKVTPPQRWTVSNGTVAQGGNCLTLAADNVGISVLPCDGGKAQRWVSSRNNQSLVGLEEIGKTVAPITKPNRSTMVNGTVVPLCLATNGSAVFAEGCRYDPPWCNATN
eukprot:SAG22_NODE_3264_length_1822_cov_1.190946_3_plen_360_part_01